MPLRLVVLALVVSVFLGAGCQSAVGVHRVSREETYRLATSTALSSDKASGFALQVLADYALADRFSEEPDRVLVELDGIFREDPRREIVFALAELSFLVGRSTRSKERYLAAALYAYGYLFDERAAGARDPYDPRFRIACDLYNASLTEFLRAEDDRLSIEAGVWELPFGRMRIDVARPGFPWGPEMFNTFLPAGDFVPRGLRDHYRNSGLGAPLIAVRSPPAEDSKNPDHLAPRAKVPATAFLRVELCSSGLPDGEFAGTLELYAPFNVHRTEVANHPVPLEADMTVPIGYALEDSSVWSFELTGFFRAKVAGVEPGIYMMQPHTPGRIPIVFVHGTASSPARWAEMVNSLQGYEKIRDRFEFWLFMYNTGNPIPYSAKVFREALLEMVDEFDPEGKDPALRQMVVIGHSQGGLLSKMVVVDSGRGFMEGLEQEGLSELNLTPEDLATIESYLVFPRVPAVRRVVFVATPHRGSFLSNRWYAKLGASLIALPKEALALGKTLLAGNETVFEKLGDRIPTSVENMTPGSRFLLSLEGMAIPPDVPVHSIIAVDGSGPVEEGDDGVVECTSAHIAEAKSEFIVRHDHSCQADPLVILEVRRILIEHLRSLEKAP